MENQKKDNRSYWKGKKLSEYVRKKLSESHIGKNTVPLIVYKDGEFYKEFDSIDDFAKELKSGHTAWKLANGWVGTHRSKFYGWRAIRKEE